MEGAGLMQTGGVHSYIERLTIPGACDIFEPHRIPDSHLGVPLLLPNMFLTRLVLPSAEPAVA